jgi:hypothetical protein
LAGLGTLRRLSIREDTPISLSGIEDLPIEELRLCLPTHGCDLTALFSLRALRRVEFAGTLTDELAAVLAKCGTPVLYLASYHATLDSAAVAALAGDEEPRLQVRREGMPGGNEWHSATTITASYLDDVALRMLAGASRLRSLRVHYLGATDLAPLVDLPSLQEFRFDIARELRSLDRVPSVRFLEDPRTPDGPNRLVLKNAPITSIRQIGNLRGVEHLDLRGCTQLTSLWGLEGMDSLRSIDLRECPGLLDMSSLEALPALRAVMVNHRGPLEPVPLSVWPKVVRNHLRGFARRLHRGEAEVPER